MRSATSTDPIWGSIECGAYQGVIWSPIFLLHGQRHSSSPPQSSDGLCARRCRVPLYPFYTLTFGIHPCLTERPRSHRPGFIWFTCLSLPPVDACSNRSLQSCLGVHSRLGLGWELFDTIPRRAGKIYVDSSRVFTFVCPSWLATRQEPE